MYYLLSIGNKIVIPNKNNQPSDKAIQTIKACAN